ncbi:hypothetical protein [Corallococcus exercitus]|uniref:hypothetical protein n=1 Tax=Corallococcus exercitus TaxID=2316736 RepID=UPI00131583B3
MSWKLEVISELPQEDEDAAEVEEAEEALHLHLHLVASHEAPEVLEPGKESLYLPRVGGIDAVLAHPGSSSYASAMRSSQLHSALVPQSLVELASVIGLAGDESPWTLVDVAQMQAKIGLWPPE